MLNFIEDLLTADKNIGCARTQTRTLDGKQSNNSCGTLSGLSLRKRSVLVGLLCPVAASAQLVFDSPLGPHDLVALDATEIRAPRPGQLAPLPTTQRRPKAPCSPQRGADKLAELHAPT